MSSEKGRMFSHLQWKDRLRIEKMLKEKKSKSEIARTLRVDYTTIMREIKRGLTVQRDTNLVDARRTDNHTHADEPGGVTTVTTVTTKNREGVSLSGCHSRHGCHGERGQKSRGHAWGWRLPQGNTTRTP